jgi:hypothetical protein
MDAETARELQKLRDEIAGLRSRIKLMTSSAGGHVSGQLNFAGWLQLQERSAPGTPAADKIRVYHKASGGLVVLDEDGSEIELDSGDIKAGEGKAMFSDGDTWGLWERHINRNGMTGYTHHFRDGLVPSGYAWVSDGDFSGEPSGLSLSYQGSYMQVTPDSGPLRHFLAFSPSVVANKSLYARVQGAPSSDVGVRIDDGSDDNYTEMYVSAGAVRGEAMLSYRYRLAGGSVTTVSGCQHLQSEPVTFRLYNYTTGGTHRGYLVNEAGVGLSITGFSRSVAWTVARVGIVVEGTSGWQAYLDWLYSDFS